MYLHGSSATTRWRLKRLFIGFLFLAMFMASGSMFQQRRPRKRQQIMATATSAAISIACKLIGVRPLMFDRYAGDNNTQLPVHEKMYLDAQRRLTLPAVNLFSMLCAENTKSVCRQFFGKNGKTIGLGMASYVTINPFEIPIFDDAGPIVFKGFNEQVYEHRTVARLAKGVPNPKQRPVVATPWSLQFTMEYIENKYCSLENLRQALTMGGMLGVGTFRPFFGRYEVEQFKIEL
jgi:hypothetical protein